MHYFMHNSRIVNYLINSLKYWGSSAILARGPIRSFAATEWVGLGIEVE